MLLDKISAINSMENAPKQPCQKLELKRFEEEMNQIKVTPRRTIVTPVGGATAAASSNISGVPTSKPASEVGEADAQSK